MYISYGKAWQENSDIYKMCHNALNTIININQELSFETIYEKLQEYRTSLNDPPLKLFDGLYSKYIRNFYKYKKEHDLLPQLFYLRQACDNFQR